MKELKSLLELQNEREKNPTIPNSFEAGIDFFAEATALLTAKFFASSAIALDRKDMTDTFYCLGLNFGKLIYLLDAYEDLGKDTKAKKFNAVHSLLKVTAVDATCKQTIDAYANSCKAEIYTYLKRLPIGQEQAEYFIKRMEENLAVRQFSKTTMVASSCKTVPKLNYKEKWTYMHNASKELMSCGTTPNKTVLKHVYVTFIAFVLWILPTHVGAQTVKYYKADSGGGNACLLIIIVLAGAACFNSICCKKEPKTTRQEVIIRTNPCCD